MFPNFFFILAVRFSILGSYGSYRCPQLVYTLCKLGIWHINKVFIIIIIIIIIIRKQHQHQYLSIIIGPDRDE